MQTAFLTLTQIPFSWFALARRQGRSTLHEGLPRKYQDIINLSYHIQW
jgi:hypothetical protein